MTKPPFEVVEVGWGEFPIQIKVFLVDTPLPVQFQHQLRIYECPHVSILEGGVVASEQVDEILIHFPSIRLKVGLESNRQQMKRETGEWKHATDLCLEEKQQTAAIDNAIAKQSQDSSALLKQLLKVRKKKKRFLPSSRVRCRPAEKCAIND